MKSESNFVSCCAIVENIERNVFILPRSKMLDGKFMIYLLIQIDSGNETDIPVTMSSLLIFIYFHTNGYSIPIQIITIQH